MPFKISSNVLVGSPAPTVDDDASGPLGGVPPPTIDECLECPPTLPSKLPSPRPCALPRLASPPGTSSPSASGSSPMATLYLNACFCAAVRGRKLGDPAGLPLLGLVP